MICHNKRILAKRNNESYISTAEDLVNPLWMALCFIVAALVVVTMSHLYVSYKSAMEVQEAFIRCIQGEGVQVDDKQVVCWSKPLMEKK